MTKASEDAGLAGVVLIAPGLVLPVGADAERLGFKAWNLARMAALGLNIPAAFVLGTEFCATPDRVTPALWREPLEALERHAGAALGDSRRPLLLSVRSGAPVSMPGMMETVLNIGLTETTLPGLLRQTGHPRLVWDAYRRLIAGYGEVVAGVPAHLFEADLDAVRAGEPERDLDFIGLRDLARRHLETYRTHHGEDFPQDARLQLQGAVEAVFRSWMSDKAIAYRAMRRIPDAIGTAVTVQRMVFGNAGGLSGAGVGFTRNPTTGDNALWVDFLFNAQGEDVVSGRRSAGDVGTLERTAPHIWAELKETAARLESMFTDMQDFEFTLQDGELFMLQTRDGKRTPQAATRIALDLYDAGLIDRDTALQRTDGLSAEQLATTRLVAADGCELTPVATAASAAAGVVCGEIALDHARVVARKSAGAKVILVRRDAETHDVAALEIADGLLTSHGARTSHAAVVARHLGKICLVGCEAMTIDEEVRRIVIADISFREGDMLTLDGHSGAIFAGRLDSTTDIPFDLVSRLEHIRSGADR